MSTQQRGEETRARILDAALEAFARYGYDATGVAEICRRAGVTKGGFYHHFASKQAVFLEMLEHWLDTVDLQLVALGSGALTVPEQLMGMTALVNRVFGEAEGKLPIFLEFLIEAGHSPTVWQATVVPFRKYHAYFANLIQVGIEEGSLRPVDPDLTAHHLISFAIGLLAQGLLDPRGADWGQVAEQGMSTLLAGLRAEPAGAGSMEAKEES